MISILFSLFLLSKDFHGPPEIIDIKSYPKQQHKCLVRNLWHEARGESFESQLWVAQTTINRMGSKNFPNSICDVVKQKNAFSWYHQIPKNKHKVKPDNKLEQKAYNQIQLVIKYARVLNYLGIDVTKGATNYYKIGTRKPAYLKKMKKIRIVGSHAYFKNKQKK